MNRLVEILNFQIVSVGESAITVSNLLLALLVLIVARIGFWLFHRSVLRRYMDKKSIDEGRAFSITQLVKYFIYVIAFFLAIQTAGLKITLLYAAGAALLVGVGIGLQHTFNDITSGIILLMEGSIQKGDWLEVGSMTGVVRRIGLRTSLIETNRKVAVIVPNSKITVENVINLSHHNNFIRYSVGVGVAYGSDTALIREVLTKCAIETPQVRATPVPRVRFIDFGDSSLNFEILFWSEEFQRIEDVKSNMRYAIDQAFRENDITIPFPQRDLHFKNTMEMRTSSDTDQLNKNGITSDD